MIVLGFSVVTKKQYEILKEEYNELLYKQSTIVDSLEVDNRHHLESISLLENEVMLLTYRLDSLQHIKTDIIVKKNDFTISSSITSGANLLRRNLDEMVISDII